jgi:hypothetical protein
MLNCFKRRDNSGITALLRRGIESTRPALFLIAIFGVLLLVYQSGCAKKSKPAVSATSTVRLVLLPFNVSSEKAELRWTALAGPILIARVSALSQDLDVVPLWQSMPATMEAAGASRVLTEESAATVASYMSAKWSTLGEFSPAPRSGKISMIIDFIPAKPSQVPFRYMKSDRLDAVESSVPEALNQFLGYLVAKPLDSTKKLPRSFTSLQGLAEALNREYGWFVDAEPGKAQEVVSNLAQSDALLARALFNPSLYPALAEAK